MSRGRGLRMNGDGGFGLGIIKFCQRPALSRRIFRLSAVLRAAIPYRFLTNAKLPIPAKLHFVFGTLRTLVGPFFPVRQFEVLPQLSLRVFPLQPAKSETCSIRWVQPAILIRGINEKWEFEPGGTFLTRIADLYTCFCKCLVSVHRFGRS